MRVLAWYSDGAASAVALRLALEKYGDQVTPYFCDTRSEHPDNVRFRADVERWLGVRVQEIHSETHSDVNDVIDREHFLRGATGAKCTTILKKIPRLKMQLPDDKHIFGYTYDEGVRIARLMAENWDLRIECPLFSAKMSKQDCIDELRGEGIQVPMMYRLGFDNNNCIGCVKAKSPNYWNRVRIHFPEEFARQAKQERELNFALTVYRGRPVFLDELTPDMKTRAKEKINCDFLCSSE